MKAWVEAIARAVAGIPLSFLEAWGYFAYGVGLVLAVLAFCRITPRRDRWGIAREPFVWDGRAVGSMAVTFVGILVTGYIGSFIVLVPGAQTFESLKDLWVFLCIVLFGYPALLAVPVAYGLSDLVEGVPPAFLRDWLPGYFMNPACFWPAYALLGADPDFRRRETWLRYGAFVVLFLAIEPVLWGHICADKFTAAISFRTITSALFFTTSLTWALGPFAMLVALPVARRFGLSRTGGAPPPVVARGWPIQIVLLGAFLAVLVSTVAATAFVALKSAEEGARALAMQLHQEVADGIQLRLDGKGPVVRDVAELLRALPIAGHGLAVIVDDLGRVAASSRPAEDPVVRLAVAAYARRREDAALGTGVTFQFDQVTEQPLGRETWLARAGRYRPGPGAPAGVVLTAMPESYYLAGVRTGNSRSAAVLAVALLISIACASWLAARVSAPLEELASAATALARGELEKRVPESRIDELAVAAESFNAMAGQLAASIDELEARVVERTAELDAARLRAESADRLKSAFLATMSHELRTPLNSIIGFTGIVLQGMAGPLNDEQSRQLGMVRSSARHLLALINDVLDLSKIEADQLQILTERFDLRDLIGSVSAVMRPAAEKKGLALELSMAPDLADMSSDRRRVEQVLLNLLSNAVKFTERGTVSLEVELARGAPGRVELRIRDTGIGIAAEDMATLFQPFRQVDTGLARQHEGTGLGLAISRRLAGLLGGTLTAKSVKGEGSTFSLELPLMR